MKQLFIFLLLMFVCGPAHASIDNFTKKIIDITNPSGADQFSQIQDITTKGGYSIYCKLSGSLQMTGAIFVSNENDTDQGGTKTFSIVSGTTQVMTTSGFTYDVVTSNVSYLKLRVGTFSGVGTAKCYLTAKDI